MPHNAIFPQLRGLGWPVNRRPVFSTIVSKSASGQEVRIANYPFALEEFDLPINHLHGNSTLAPNLADFQQLYGFYCARLGPWESFLYFDPADNNTITNATYEGLTPVTAQNVIATGDGVTLAFQLTRNLGGDIRPIYDINGPNGVIGTGVQAPTLVSPYINVYLAGVQYFGAIALSTEGVLTFGSAPGAGVVIASDFSYFKRVCFSDDNIQIENFMANLFRVKKITLRQVFA
jgi:uncharacterized protein (TIGR02217 family)